MTAAVFTAPGFALFADLPAGWVLAPGRRTINKKTGRKVNGAGTFRDAVRSTGARVVYAWRLNLVIITRRNVSAS